MAESSLLDLPLQFPDLDTSCLAAAAGDLTVDDFFDWDFDIDFDLPADDGSTELAPPRQPSGDSSGISSSSAGSPSSPDSGGSSAASGVSSVIEGAKRKNEDGGGGGGGGGGDDGHCPNPNLNFNTRSSKARRLDDGSAAAAATAVVISSEEEKRQARLVRNRESAQLSRQRKKLYVEELEEKVKAMHATINELNSWISYVAAENSSLRQQLVGSNGNCAPLPPTLYPPPPVHFPWVPGYALRPQGSPVPLVPIPRLKPRQAEPPAAKAKKAVATESKKREGKTKKVPSVSLLGLLALMLVCGALIPAANHIYGKDRGILDLSRGSVLAVRGHSSGRNNKSYEMALEKDGLDSTLSLNSRETLPALLYLPRNGKHVKINGNLVINSVLASERAIANQGKEETSLAILQNVGSSEAWKVPESYKSSRGHMMALPPRSGDTYAEDNELSRADGSLPQWFSERMAGPMLSSGMCTEVFHFEVSPSSAHANDIVPAYSPVTNSSVNSTEKLPASSHSDKMKNRRILYSKPMPLAEAAPPNTERLEKRSNNGSYGSNKPISPVVVSILADPREAGDGESDARISSKSLSRIFVVVLIDSVKYVTYSCVLPFKNHSPHL